MARYPDMVGPWATKPYGADEEAWEEAKRQCRAGLLEWAAARHPGTYTELTHRINALPWPDGAFTHHGQQMGYLLGQVSLEELVRTQDRPVLSSLVIGREDGMPTAGYWNFLRDELGVTVPETEDGRLQFWLAEFEAACDYYGSRAPSPS